jgi:hypothetical protein
MMHQQNVVEPVDVLRHRRSCVLQPDLPGFGLAGGGKGRRGQQNRRKQRQCGFRGSLHCKVALTSHPGFRTHQPSSMQSVPYGRFDLGQTIFPPLSQQDQARQNVIRSLAPYANVIMAGFPPHLGWKGAVSASANDLPWLVRPHRAGLRAAKTRRKDRSDVRITRVKALAAVALPLMPHVSPPWPRKNPRKGDRRQGLPSRCRAGSGRARRHRHQAAQKRPPPPKVEECGHPWGMEAIQCAEAMASNPNRAAKPLARPAA